MESGRTLLGQLSVEEENLASIPFAVLESRVGKRLSKLEVSGTKVLPDGQEMHVVWQVQGNSDLGLPTEQDLDFFVALGVLTFQNNFQKTVSFSGREVAQILNVKSVHGKFYRRLKLAMDRFIPLRFRALAATDRHEDVKWVNVFQEASFSVDRETGRCMGSVTWNDKVIQSMNAGFFRLLDAGRYKELGGITAKHLYRYLAIAFEKSDVLMIDARKLATDHLAIPKLPRYFSRLMQTLEPALEQLIEIEVLGSYHIVSAEEWRLALRRHEKYVPTSRALLEAPVAASPLDNGAAELPHLLEQAGFTAEEAVELVTGAATVSAAHELVRAARLIVAMREEGVLDTAALAVVRKALEAGRDEMDWCEIAVEVCRQKRRARQSLRNPAGLLMQIARDSGERERLVPAAVANSLRERFRTQERVAVERRQDEEERVLVLQYEEFRRQLATDLWRQMSEPKRQVLWQEKTAALNQQERYRHMAPELRQREIENLILQDIARNEAPRFEKWMLRRKAEQAVFPFETVGAVS